MVLTGNPRICPLCGREYDQPPALSRKDNKTEICPSCGMLEALFAIPAFSFNPLWKTLIDRHMTRGQLCRAAHLSRATVIKMGKNKPVSLDVIARVCLALSIPVEQVIEIRHNL